jgi:hypothetical protein
MNKWSTSHLIAMGAICFIIGIIVGMLFLGPNWFVSQDCTHYPFLLLDPKLYVACKTP